MPKLGGELPNPRDDPARFQTQPQDANHQQVQVRKWEGRQQTEEGGAAF